MERAELEAELEKHHADGFGWAMACCRWDRVEAEEVLQTAYLKVLDGSARFGARASFRTWLFAVIRRTAAERRRRARIRGLLWSRWLARRPPPDRSHPDPNLASLDATDRLVRALARLAPRQRQVLHLVFYLDLSIAEAARAMGVSVGAARTHYARGKLRLRSQLHQEDVP